MATPVVNVFGEPVTGDTRKERAEKALSDLNTGGKNDQATDYLMKQKETWQNGVVTLCMFYNATGQPLYFSKPNSRNGVVDDNGYPETVKNGQWGAFSHGQKSTVDAPLSVGYVIYSGTIINTELSCKQLFAWETRGNASNNLVYCDILDDDVPIDSGTIYYHMGETKQSKHVASKMKMSTTTTIDPKGTTPFYKAILTIDETPANKNSV